MSNEKTITVAKALAVQVHATEEAIDTALAEAAHLIEDYVASRRAVRMSATITGDIHENTLKAMMALAEAQQHMSAAHQGLNRVRKQMRLAPNAVIPPYDKPDPDAPPKKDGITGSFELSPTERIRGNL